MPTGWRRYTSADGRAYFYNPHAAATQWDPPVLRYETEGGRPYHYDPSTGPTSRTAMLGCFEASVAEHDAAPDAWDTEETQERVQRLLAEELAEELPRRAVVNTAWLWRSWGEFAAGLARSGGVIGASPLELHSSPWASLFIERYGGVTLTSTHEQILSPAFTFVGAAVPQTAVPFAALREAALAIGRECFARKIIGHVGIDFVAFLDAAGLLRVWAVDLNLRLTHTALTFGFFDFLVGGEFDAGTGDYYAPPKSDGTPEPRCYVMNELLYHPQLPAMHHSAFFNMCRLKGVSFDLVHRTGTVFNLMDSFASGVLGILTTGRSMLDALRKFADTLDFIQKQVGPATTKSTSTVNETSFTDVIHAIKQLVDKQVGGSAPVPAQEPGSKYLSRGSRQ